MADLIGNRYRLMRRLGIGGMGEVYAARDERLERDVAIKKLTFFSGSIEQLEMFTKRFKREAVSMAQFIHPYIVPVYDFGEEDGSLYLVMGLMTGGSLKEKMGDPMSVIEAVKLLIPIASALSYVHENGVIHRDVKPANILFNQRGTPMLADFGIVKLMETEGVTLTAAGSGVGTPAYMAPEQVTNDLDHRIDQYSLGIIFYELVTGKRPYQGDTPVMTLIKHRTEPLPDPRQFVPDLSEEVVAVLSKVLAKERDERYADMDAFEQALRELMAKESTESALHFKDAAEEIAEELIEDAAEEMAEDVIEEFVAADHAAETQISAEPAEIPIPPTATLVEAEPAEEEVDLNANLLDSQPVVEEPESIDADATVLDSQPVMEEPAAEAEEVDHAAETQLSAQPRGEASDAQSIEDVAEGATEIMGAEAATEIFDDGSPTALIETEEPTELMEAATAPAPPKAVQQATVKKKFPLWIAPVALVVLAGLVVGLLAILQVGPFMPEATPRPTYSSYEYDTPAEDSPADEQPQEEEQSPGVAPLDEENELSICIWKSGEPLMVHMMDVFQEHNPGVELRLEVLGNDCKEPTFAGNFDFTMQPLTPEERLLHPDAQEFHIGYTPAIFNIHRDIGIEYLTWDDLYAIFTGEATNWSQLGGFNTEIIPVAAEGTFPWSYVNYSVIGESSWREDMVYLDSLEEVNAYVDETWGAIAITGTRAEPEHILPVGVDGVLVSYESLALGQYPMQWENVLTSPRNWDAMGAVNQRFIEFIYSDEGWENLWAPHYVPWYKDFGEANTTEEGNLRIVHSATMNHLIPSLAASFMEQHPGWVIEHESMGANAGFEEMINDQANFAGMGFTSEDQDFDNYLEGQPGFLYAYQPAFFWSHGDMGIEGLSWETYYAILHGDVTNWVEVGGPDEEIIVVIPEEHIVYSIIKYEFFGGEELPDHIIRVTNLDEVVGFLEGNPNALGIGAIFSCPDFVVWMAINDIEVNEDTLRSGEYPLRWSFLLVTKNEPDELEQAFLDFIGSDQGVQVIWEAGAVPAW